MYLTGANDNGKVTSGASNSVTPSGIRPRKSGVFFMPTIWRGSANTRPAREISRPDLVRLLAPATSGPSKSFGGGVKTPNTKGPKYEKPHYKDAYPRNLSPICKTRFRSRYARQRKEGVMADYLDLETAVNDTKTAAEILMDILMQDPDTDMNKIVYLVANLLDETRALEEQFYAMPFKKEGAA